MSASDLHEGVDPDFEKELREFLSADGREVEADPLFRERLRRRLWAMVLERQSGPRQRSE